MQGVKCCAVIGSAGKMGSIACEALKREQILPLEISKKSDLTDIIKYAKPCVALELSNRESVFANSMIVVQQSVPLIVGASGLTVLQKETLNRLACRKRVPVWVIPNFSVAAVAMIQASLVIAQWLPSCEIIEYHHEKKQDAPSATSLSTAQKVSEVQPVHQKYISETAGYVFRDKIPIHSVRTPAVMARQDVIFAQTGESLTLSLSQIDRKSFVPGILLTVQKVCTLAPGLHEGLEVGL